MKIEGETSKSVKEWMTIMFWMQIIQTGLMLGIALAFLFKVIL